MSFFDPAWNFRGESDLYRSVGVPSIGSEPISIIQGPQNQHLYADDFYYAEPEKYIISENPLLGGSFAASLLEPPLADHEPVLIQGQQDQPLHANFYRHVFAQPPVAEPQENVEGPHAEPNWELEPVDIQLHHPVFEPQENIVNAEGPQAEPGRELELAIPQPYHLPPLAIPAIPDNAAYGIGNRLGQEFRCGNKCRGVFAGPHKCSYRGRSLTISCHGDGNCPGFSKRNDFNRHCDTVHRGARAGAPVKKLWDCPFADCDRVGDKGFNRKDNLTQHRRNVHEEQIAKVPVRFGRA